MTRAQDPLGLGPTIARKYRVQAVHAEGGFSVVYRGWHVIWNKPVAIKVLKPLANIPTETWTHVREDFLREGALLAELSSSSAAIVQAWDVGTHLTTEGELLPYLILEWLEGRTLSELLRERPRPWTLADVRRYIGPVARALGLAHERGIAHRDIKPANLFVVGDLEAGTGVLKLLDFGVAKVMQRQTAQASLARTASNVHSFTPDYGAPEQFDTRFGATGPWTDVFALALVMVELLSGRPPLEGNEVVSLGVCTTNREERPSPRSRGVPLPAAVEAVFLRALAVDPSARFATANELWDALEQACETTNAITITPDPAELDRALRSLQQGDVRTEPSFERGPRAAGRTRALPAFGAAASLTALAAGAAAFGDVGAIDARMKRAAPAFTEGFARTFHRFDCPEGSVRIQAGQFYMGSEEPDALPTEKPQFPVKLDAFCMDVTEVTLKDYMACSDSGRCKRPASTVRWPGLTEHQSETYSPLCNVRQPGRGDHPVNCVDWSMADHYCRERGGRLPTEAEWEYGARGPDGRIYPWGDEDPTPQHLNACGSECVAWGREHEEPLEPLYAGDDGFPSTAPVGRFPAGRSRFGLMDVVGNVWEWVSDWSAPYTPGEKSNPAGPARGERRVIRGGGWNGSFKHWLRPSFRYAQDPAALSHGIGFRCAFSLPRPVR